MSRPAHYFLLFCLALLMTQTAGAQQSKKGDTESKTDVVSHVVLVVDSTESMSWPNRTGQPSRATLARHAASLVVDMVPAETPFCVLVLQDGVSSVRPMSPLRASDRHNIRASLKDLRSKGHGKLTSCFTEVERILRQTPQGDRRLELADVRPLIVVITDGDDCQPDAARGYASVLNSHFSAGMRLAMIGLCTREAVAEPLRSLAKSGKGWYSQLESEDGLAAALARARDECNAIRNRRPAVDPQLAQQAAALEKESATLKNALSNTEKELEKCQAAGKEKDRQISQQETELTSVKGERDEVKKELDTKRDELTRMEKDSAALVVERDQLKVDKKAAEDRVTTLTDDLLKETRTMDADIRKLTTQEGELAREVKSVADLETTMSADLKTLEGQVNNWWKQLLNSSLGIGLLSVLVFIFKTPALKGLVKSFVNNEALSTQFDGVKSEVTAEVGNVKTDVGVVTAEIGNVKTEVGVVKSEVTAVKTGIDEVKSSVAGVQAGVEEKVQQLNSEVAEQLSSFDRQLAERMQQFEAQLRETSLTLTSDIGTASSSVKTVETKVDSTNAKADEIEKALSSVQSQLAQTDQAVVAKVESLETAVTETRNDVKESMKETVVAKLDSIEKTVSESKSESRQLAGENQRTLASQIAGVQTAVSLCKDEVVSGVRSAVAASEKTIETTCRESAAQVVQKVDALGQTISSLHVDQQQVGTEVRHVAQTVNPLARAVADTQAGMQSQSAEARVEFEKKLNKLSRDLTKAVEKVHGRIELRTKDIGDSVRLAQQQMVQQVKKQVRRLGTSVAEQVRETVAQSVHGQ
ncbi:MAG: VWA domain-containing protein, partial [Planctomycetes bacterium]|nr:VWA domain-containing protein [Planctomycetota bacterium]